MEGYIYKITNKVNNKCYIGQTRYSVEFRWRQHQHCYDGAYIHNAIQKYGVDNFTVEEIEKCPVELLNARETFYIAKYDSFANGYNMTIGGDGRRKLILDDKYDEMKFLYLAGFSSVKIGELYNVDNVTVVKILKQLGVKIRSNKLNINKQEFEELVELYNTGYSLKQLAKRYNCSDKGLKEFLEKRGVNLRVKYSIIDDLEGQENMINDYLDDKMKLQEILRKYKVSYDVFKRVLSIHGIDKKGQKFHFKMSDKECLECIRLYKEGKQIKDLAHKYKVDRTTIYNMFKRYHVDYLTV